MQQTVCVVHLVWIPYGIEMFKGFIDSYRSYPAGHPHQLVLLFNGVENEQETALYHQYTQQFSLSYQSFYYSRGQDLEAYYWVAKQLACEQILFLNGYSRFLASNWLQKFIEAYTSDIGIISATGSWQSYYTNVFETNSWRWMNNMTRKQNINKYRLMLKAALLWRFYFQPFPNPHIRTNGFFIRRSLFASLVYKNPRKKFGAYRIESGRNSITQQVLKKGWKVLIVDKAGKTYPPEEWDKIKVFWSGQQENLLIADNQTQSYSNASQQEKRRLAYNAWHHREI